MSELRYAFLTSLSQLLSCYGTDSEGRAFVRDHAQWPIGDFDSVPGLGFVALAAATGYQLGFIDRGDAETLVKKCLDSLLEVPGHSTGWLPHWLKDGERHPDSEYSTVDTALAYISAIKAAVILGLDTELSLLKVKVAALDFESLIIEVDGKRYLSMGIDHEGKVIPYYWSAWGGETKLVQLLATYRDNPVVIDGDTQPPAYGGRGFITELAALYYPDYGGEPGYKDEYGFDWHQARKDLYSAQIAFFGLAPVIFGLSHVEVISRYGSTAYAELGAGAGDVAAMDGFSDKNWGSPWPAPHYLAMVSSLDTEAAATGTGTLTDLGVLLPLSGPAESVLQNKKENIIRLHTVRTSLNAFFNSLGYYHAVVNEEGTEDAVYNAVIK